MSIIYIFFCCCLVCYLNGTDFQCRCEDQYVWSYVNCITYGACDDIIDGTCGCINSIPSSGQHCEPRKGNIDMLEAHYQRLLAFRAFNCISQPSFSKWSGITLNDQLFLIAPQLFMNTRFSLKWTLQTQINWGTLWIISLSLYKLTRKSTSQILSSLQVRTICCSVLTWMVHLFTWQNVVFF